MSLTRTHMSAMEATELACIVDRSHLPVHVKRVTEDGTVEVQDDNTGYVLPIISHDHWKQYVRQVQGDHNAIDEFANAGVVLLAQLDKMLEGLRFERDNLMEQAEKVDTQVTHYQKQRDAIEAAIAATNDVSLLASVRGVTVPQVSQPTTRKLRNGSHKHEWVVSKITPGQQFRVSDMADDMAAEFSITRKEAIKAISGVLSRMMKSEANLVRQTPGVYLYFNERPING